MKNKYTCMWLWLTVCLISAFFLKRHGGAGGGMVGKYCLRVRIDIALLTTKFVLVI